MNHPVDAVPSKTGGRKKIKNIPRRIRSNKFPLLYFHYSYYTKGAIPYLKALFYILSSCESVLKMKSKTYRLENMLNFTPFSSLLGCQDVSTSRFNNLQTTIFFEKQITEKKNQKV